MRALDVSLDRKSPSIAKEAAANMFGEQFEFSASGFPAYGEPGIPAMPMKPATFVDFLKNGFPYFRTVHAPFEHQVVSQTESTVKIEGRYLQTSWFPATPQRPAFVRQSQNWSELELKQESGRWVITRWAVDFVVVSEQENLDFYGAK